jgi:hypothetical protein
MKVIAEMHRVMPNHGYGSINHRDEDKQNTKQYVLDTTMHK